jgi:hypothetical protein
MSFEIIPAGELLIGYCASWIETIEHLYCVHVFVNAALMTLEVRFEREG